MCSLRAVLQWRMLDSRLSHPLFSLALSTTLLVACGSSGLIEGADSGDDASAEGGPVAPDGGAVVGPDGAPVPGKDAGPADASPDTRPPDAGVGCGGPTAPKCAEGQVCAVDQDCASGVCSTGKRCVSSASCRGGPNGASGIDTCGTGEPGAPGAVVESCCRSLPLPARPTRRLDRYEITGGRVRAFLDDLAAKNGGVPNVRAFAEAQAAANPTSQLGSVAAGYPGLVGILPDRAGPNAQFPMPVHLGAYPLDPINALDGCYVSDDSYGHATYWQAAADVRGYGIGARDAQGVATGVRRYSREELDKKPVNCMMALFLAAFCAWDGGELARTADFRAVWGRRPTPVGTTTVYVPWAAILPVGGFNWRNGHGAACNPTSWPGCVNPQPYFYQFPQLRPDGMGPIPAQDDSAAIAAPGRFKSDVTAIVSASGEGWYDVGGNLMEMAWPVGTVNPGANAVQNVCDVSATPGPGDTPCVRRGNDGVQRYTGPLPHVALVGYSFEGHARRSENYLSNMNTNEGLIVTADLKPITFQYGKVGARCARGN